MGAKTIDSRNKYARFLLELESWNYEITSVRMQKTVSRLFTVEKEEYFGIGVDSLWIQGATQDSAAKIERKDHKRVI